MTAATPQPSGDERAVIPEGPTGRRPRSARSDRFERASTASDLDTSLFHWEQRRSHDAAQDIQRLWRGVRARRYVLMLLQRREEEEDEEDAREMDRVVVLKEEEVEWWEVEDNERNEQDDVEVVEVAWRLHRERRVLRDLTQLYAICKFGVAEVTARQQIKKQVYAESAPIAFQMLESLEGATRTAFVKSERQFRHRMAQARMQWASLMGFRTVARAEGEAREWLVLLFEGLQGLQRRWEDSRARLSAQCTAEFLQLSVTECLACEAVGRRDAVAARDRLMGVVALETEERRMRMRQKFREICGRAAVERAVGDVKYGWECAGARRGLAAAEEDARAALATVERTARSARLAPAQAEVARALAAFHQRRELGEVESRQRGELVRAHNALWKLGQQLHATVLGEAAARAALEAEIEAELPGLPVTCFIALETQERAALVLQTDTAELSIAEIAARDLSACDESNMRYAQYRSELAGRHTAVALELLRGHGLLLDTGRLSLTEARARAEIAGEMGAAYPEYAARAMADREGVARAMLTTAEALASEFLFTCPMWVECQEGAVRGAIASAELQAFLAVSMEGAVAEGSMAADELQATKLDMYAGAGELVIHRFIEEVEELRRTLADGEEEARSPLQAQMEESYTESLQASIQKRLQETLAQEDLLRGNLRLAERMERGFLENRGRNTPISRGCDLLFMPEFSLTALRASRELAPVSPCRTLEGTLSSTIFSRAPMDFTDPSDPFLLTLDNGLQLGVPDTPDFDSLRPTPSERPLSEAEETDSSAPDTRCPGVGSALRRRRRVPAPESDPESPASPRTASGSFSGSNSGSFTKKRKGKKKRASEAGESPPDAPQTQPVPRRRRRTRSEKALNGDRATDSEPSAPESTPGKALRQPARYRKTRPGSGDDVLPQAPPPQELARTCSGASLRHSASPLGRHVPSPDSVSLLSTGEQLPQRPLRKVRGPWSRGEREDGVDDEASPMKVAPPVTECALTNGAGFRAKFLSPKPRGSPFNPDDRDSLTPGQSMLLDDSWEDSRLHQTYDFDLGDSCGGLSRCGSAGLNLNSSAGAQALNTSGAAPAQPRKPGQIEKQARYERDKYEWEKYDKPSKLSNEYKTEDLETTLDAHAKAIYQSKIKELEFFYQNQEQQPGGDKPANLHPVRWRDRWQNRAGGKRNLLQPLPKGQVCPQDAQPVREMEPVDPLSPITIV